MGFRCSLLGHDYGEPTTEEEREERGNEVVVTVRELETCSRCGAETVISENTEVRSIDSAANTESDADAAAVESEADGEGTDGEAADGADDAMGDVQSPAEDDGVILEDDDRDAGEWPADDSATDGEAGDAPAADDDAAAAEAEDASAEPVDDADLDRNGTTEATDLTEWPDPGVEDEGFDAEPASGDDVDVEFGGGLQPEAADADTDESAEYVSASGSGITSTGPVERSDDPDTVLVCPECEFGEESVATSQRPGDICPECRRGYLTERER